MKGQTNKIEKLNFSCRALWNTILHVGNT